ncbi:Bromodomain [Pseudocohnilembus persalinus]|uniref:Bromodomain n=1 Tax=Pseudocohnilembus persalinus TaxID=266149 RepID=A0A0V0QQZ7_PSEPJ|nr:Bromodomain [Pseudocohnilembus persalinus]|eukprot:KRX04432.1 Bromodomain [Pseudocohnilembus persalinus]
MATEQREKHQKHQKDGNEFSNQLKQIWEEINNLSISVAFQRAVDKKSFPDYYKIIQNPMDLSKIRRKINQGKYRTKKEFGEDLKQISANCKQYNLQDSDIYVTAEEFEKKAQKIINKHFTKNKQLIKKQQLQQQQIMGSSSQDIMGFKGSETHIMINNSNITNQTTSKRKNEKVSLNSESNIAALENKTHNNKKVNLGQSGSNNINNSQNNVGIVSTQILQSINNVTNENSWKQSQKMEFLEKIGRASQEQLFRMVKIVDKYENYNIQMSQNGQGLYQYHFGMNVLDNKTVQKMLDVLNNNYVKEEYNQGQIKQEIKEE